MTGAAETDLSAPTAVPPAGNSSAVSEVTQTPGGASVNVDVSAPTQAQLAAPTEVQNSWLKTVPEGYGEKPWVSELAKQDNPLAAMFKEFENQRSMIGRKGDGLKVPTADSPPEAWQEFNQEVRKATGVPEKAEDYAYEAPKPPQGLENLYGTDEKLLNTMREAAHKAGVTPQGWKALVDSFNTYSAATVQDAVAQLDGQLKATEQTFKGHYGEKSPQVLANFEKAASSAPEWAQPILNALQPATKAAIASLLFNFSSKYVSEDRLDVRGLNAPTTMTSTEYGDRYEKLFAKVRETEKNPHGAEHLRAKQELAQLRAMGAEVFKNT